MRLKYEDRPQSGRCWKCDEPARGGSWARRGIERVPLCKACSSKDETDLYLTHRQADRLAAAARELGGRHELLVVLGLNLGPRISELLSLKGSDFDFDEGRVRITTLKRRRHTKLPVYFSPKMGKLFKRLVGKKKGFLFPRGSGSHGKGRGGPLSRWMGARIFREVADRAGISEKVTPHAMRHYCAIKLLEATKDIEFVSRQLRHANLATTQKYLHLLPERAATMAAKVEVT